MKKTFLIFALLTLGFGLPLLSLEASALSEEEEKYVDSILTSDSKEFDYYDCNANADADEFLTCLEESEEYINICETGSAGDECEVSSDYNDGVEPAEEAEESEDANFGEEDAEFLASFLEGKATVEEEESEPASIIPVIVVSILGLAIIIVLNIL